MLSLMSLLDEDEEGHHEVEKTRCCKGNSISELGPGGGCKKGWGGNQASGVSLGRTMLSHVNFLKVPGRKL